MIIFGCFGNAKGHNNMQAVDILFVEQNKMLDIKNALGVFEITFTRSLLARCFRLITISWVSV